MDKVKEELLNEIKISKNDLNSILDFSYDQIKKDVRGISDSII